MLFNSLDFMIFLPIVLLLFYWLKNLEAKIVLLLCASIFFYGWWKIEYVPLLLGSIIVNYFVAQMIHHRRVKGRGHQSILTIGICFNLALLGTFKYTDFAISSVNQIADAGFPVTGIILPLAISFFTFQQIAYLVDAAAGKTKANGFLDYALFVSFFPQLIAGPIVHHSEMMPQFKKSLGNSKVELNLVIGLAIFVIGLIKKILIADNIAPYADEVFNAANAGDKVTFFIAWAGSISYTLQLYFDFSGYADMAIGIARMFGIKLPLNFHSPYKAASIIEFWKRWHMTLSRFLKDYLYIPLGGNRKSTFRKYTNLMITMVLGGLWHGAGWTFIIWGTLHGIYLLANHAWRGLIQHLGIQKPVFGMRFVGVLVTFLAVVIGWVFFRSENYDTALNILAGMIGLNGVPLPATLMVIAEPVSGIFSRMGIEIAHGNPGIPPTEFLLIAGGLIIIWMAPNTQQIMAQYSPALMIGQKQLGKHSADPGYVVAKHSRFHWRITPAWAVFQGIILAFTILVGLGVESPFLYFQF